MPAEQGINQHPVHREARQVAQNLATSLGLGVNVAVRPGSSLLYLYNFEGKLAPRSFTLMGRRNKFSQYAQIETAIAEQVQAVLVGSSSPADAMKAAGEAAQGLID